MPMTYLNHNESNLKQLGGYWTAKEICQQPNAWKKTLEQLKAHKSEIDFFLKPILTNKKLRIILTGAGTSAFIGNIIESALSTDLGLRVEAIPSTDLVSNPHEHFHSKIPTLLVSFARSGNSPESLAAVDYAEKIIEDCYQLAVTCNKDGLLYQSCQGTKNMALLMPEETNDKSLAMTSSFSSMLLASLYVFCKLPNFEEKLRRTIASTETLIINHSAKLKNMAAYNYHRVVYLGSGVFKGLAQESALKLLELTDGKIISSYDSPLGFRHGPKAIVNDKTLVVIFVSNQEHTRKFDIDLLNEIENDKTIGAVLAVSAYNLEAEKDKVFSIEKIAGIEDIFLLLPYITFAQIYAFQRSINLGNSPDNPSSSGAINRVVKGVTIHSL